MTNGDRREFAVLINEAMKPGWTPVLGAACSLLVGEGSQAEQEVIRIYSRLLWLRDRIVMLRPDEDKERIARYFRGFAASTSLAQVKEPSPSPPQFSVPFGNEVVQFLEKLGTLSYLLTRRFFSWGAVSPTPISDMRRVSVPHPGSADVDASVCGDLCSLYANLYRDAKVLERAVQEELLHRELLGVLGKLMTLGSRLFLCAATNRKDNISNACRSCLRQFEELGITNKRYQADDRSPPAMRLVHIEWLTELLWYVLTIDSSLFPSTSELAFRISLFEDFHDPERRCLAETAQGTQAASRNDDTALVEVIATLIRNAGFPKDGPNLFYRTLAERMVRNTSRPVIDNSEEIRRQRHATFRLGATDVYEGKHSPVPMVLSTNYDVELEKAFDLVATGYHVFFPVWILRKDDGPGMTKTARSPRWVMKTLFRVSDPGYGPAFMCETWLIPEKTDPEFTPDSKGVESKTQDIRSFTGSHLPVIVKLHGSPLEDLKGIKFLGKNDLVPCHWLSHRIVMSESQYLADVLTDVYCGNSREGLCHSEVSDALRRSWLADEGRFISFMGHSIADWNIRLRITRESLGRQNAWALNRSLDPYAEDSLIAMGIHAVRGTLEQFSTQLRARMCERR